MARPQKNGIDYFPLDVGIDDKLEIVEAKYGIEGFGIIVRLWQKIYANSYFLEWNEEKLLLFKKAVNVNINLINDIINDCFRWNLFNKKLYEDYHILTSVGIQKRYIEATQRRKEIYFINEYLLIENVTEKYAKTVNVYINRVNVDIMYTKTELMYNIGTQSKVKESKVNIHTNAHAHEEEEFTDYNSLMAMLKSVCPTIFNRQISQVNNGNIQSIAVINDLLSELNFGMSEYEKLFSHVDKTYIVKPKYLSCDILWILNNIKKVQDIPEDLLSKNSKQVIVNSHNRKYSDKELENMIDDIDDIQL